MRVRPQSSHRLDLEAAGALDVHEEGVRRLHHPLQLVPPLLQLLGRVQKVHVAHRYEAHGGLCCRSTRTCSISKTMGGIHVTWRIAPAAPLPGVKPSTAGGVVVAAEVERPSEANHAQLVLVLVRHTPGRRACLAAVASDAAVGTPPQRTRMLLRLCVRAAWGTRGEAAALAAGVTAEHRVLPRGGRGGRATGPVRVRRKRVSTSKPTLGVYPNLGRRA